MKPTKNTPTKEQLAAAFATIWPEDKGMVDYCANKVDTAVILSNGAIFTIDKEEIEKHFCFGWSSCGQGLEFDDAVNMQLYASRSENYFREKNKVKSAELLHLAQTAPYMYTYVRYQGDTAGVLVGVLALDRPAEIYRVDYSRHLPENLRPVSEADRAAIVSAYEEHHRRHCKKVDAYLKRYGLSKVRTWTYWRDE